MPTGVYIRTPEIREIIKKASKLSMQNPDIRKRISIGVKKHYSNKPRWNKGKKHSEEHNKKVSAGVKRFYDKKGRVSNYKDHGVCSVHSM